VWEERDGAECGFWFRECVFPANNVVLNNRVVGIIISYSRGDNRK
jgi:parallel beta-helix repeat protein